MPVTCPACGFASPDGMKFCGDCGERIVERPTEGVTRRLATILFADVTGSTALGERVDPETLRAIMNRYFVTMRSVIESHGGTVEKFIGDAVMSVFGMPQLHEDDALRAVRAAVDIRLALDELNADLQRERGFEIRFRTGVNTGEVVAGDPASRTTLVTGDTVNSAARLEQAASPGDILIGHVTRTLVRDAVLVEEIEPIAAKGKAEPLRAYRVVSLRSEPRDTAAGRTPLVGREAELDELVQTHRRHVAHGTSALVTVVGTAGIGKSRLVDAFLGVIGGSATVLRGQCLSYGAGITYWPIAEIVRAAAGITEGDSVIKARARIRALFHDDPDGAEREADLSSAIGLASEAASRDDISFAVRRLFERIGRDRPLVVLVEDIHWAEPALLDLLEEVVEWSRVAIQIVCLTRPDLFEDRATWGEGPTAVTIHVSPLTPDAVATLIAESPGRSMLPDDVIERVIGAADGNPLFVEELLQLLDDDAPAATNGDDAPPADPTRVVVPPSIQALLAARLDRLAVPERATAQRASVIGRTFEVPAVAVLGAEADRATVADALAVLVRRQVIEPAPADVADVAADVYRFRHALLREAAYEGLSKGDRASLHERFADWVVATSGERLSEVEEIVAYHLEQAHRYVVELGGSADLARRLGDGASARLASAGGRAYTRADFVAAANLLGRARRLAAGPAERARLGAHLANCSYHLGRFRDAITIADEVSGDAATAGLPAVAADASLSALGAREALGEVEAGGLWSGVRAAKRTFEEVHDEGGLARVTALESLLHSMDGDERASIEAARASARHAQRAGDAMRAARAYSFVADSLAYGPGDVRPAILEIEAGLATCRAEPDAMYLVASSLAVLHAMAGDGAAAHAYLDESEGIALARGRTQGRSSRVPAALVAMLLDRPADAIDVVAAELERCRQIGADRVERQHAAVLGELRLRKGDVQGARAVVEAIGAIHPSDQLEVASRIEVLRAGVASAGADHASAREHARAAIDLLDATDWLLDRGDAWLRLAEVTHAAGDRDDAAAAARRAIELFAEKGNVATGAKAHRVLQAIEAGTGVAVTWITEDSDDVRSPTQQER